MSQLLYYIPICSLLLIGCGSQDHTIEENIHKIEITPSTPDSLVDFYTQVIYKHYNDTNTDDYKVELDLEGKREYEDDSILILTFDEILKYGSWHYTDASLCFFKNGSELIPIAPTVEGKQLTNDFFEREIQYPNRINGVIKELIDLTGDGIPEYIFYSYALFRDNFDERYDIYQLNSDNHTLERLDLSISSNGILGGSDGDYGELRDYKIIGNDSRNPIIEINEVINKPNDSTFEVEKISNIFSYFTWDNHAGRFKKILPTKTND